MAARKPDAERTATAREKTRLERQRQRQREKDRVELGLVPVQAQGKSWRIGRLRDQGGRTWDQIAGDPSLRHIGDIEGVVQQMNLASLATVTFLIPLKHAQEALEAMVTSQQGAMLFMRVFVVDPPHDWIETDAAG